MVEVLVEFDRAIQSVGPLQEAAYRIIGIASCILQTTSDQFVCRLQPVEGEVALVLGEHGIRQRFVDLVTDENLREKVSAETAGLRNVILALAFGALAQQDDRESGT